MERGKSIVDYPGGYYSVYTLIIILIGAYYFLSIPIMKGDTDLWYHLNGGQYIWENREIPRDSFFSFISPARAWTNYYWLFQLVVYKIYAVFGYIGLIGLRTAIFMITAGIIG